MPTLRIGVIDYESGNLHSVSRALVEAGGAPELVTDPAQIETVDMLVLPGVGNFGDAAKRLDERGFRAPLVEYLRARRPFLGICLGLQLLFEESDEAPGVAGLGVYRGRVRRFPSTVAGKRLIVPAIGWNRVTPVPPHGGELFEEKSEHYYFVHSYYVEPVDEGVTAGTADYALTYTCALADPPVYATQFHTEKSGAVGLALLRRILKKCRCVKGKIDTACGLH